MLYKCTMSEGAIEQTERKENVDQLQRQFVKFIDETHQLAGQAYGEAGSRFLVPGGHNQESSVNLAHKFMLGFDTLYRNVPEGFHLDIGLSPLAWYKIIQDEDAKLLSRKEMTPTGPQYYLRVGRYVDNPATMEPNRRTLNLTPIGSTDPKDPSARLEGIMLSKSMRQTTNISLLPEDIIAIKITANPQTK